MTNMDEKRGDGKIGGGLLKVLTANYNALVSARADEGILKQYSALLRFLRAQPSDFLEGFIHEKRRPEELQLLPGIIREGLQTAPLNELEKLVNDDGIPRKYLERIAIERFSVPRGSMRSFWNNCSYGAATAYDWRTTVARRCPWRKRIQLTCCSWISTCRS